MLKPETREILGKLVALLRSTGHNDVLFRGADWILQDEGLSYADRMANTSVGQDIRENRAEAIEIVEALIRGEKRDEPL